MNIVMQILGIKEETILLYTSYFAQLRNLPENVIPISICGKAPEWYKGLQYKKVAPKYGFFMEWKKNHDNDYYIEHYNREVLSQLNARGVVDELYDLLPDELKNIIKEEGVYKIRSQEVHIALICYEKPGDFCHRHLLAEWLTSCGFECKEWVKP